MAQTQQKTEYSFIPIVINKFTAKVYRWRNRVPQGALERLELLDAKVSRAVLRGRVGGNTALLLDVPAVAHVSGRGTRFFGNGRNLRHMRRRFYARRKQLQKAKKTRAVKKSKGKESRWMKNINHQLSRQIVNHAHEQGVGTLKVESLAGIRKGTTRTSGGAKARKNNRMQNSWSFYQLTTFITYKAERLGITVEQVDPAYTSKECPACGARNTARDRTYVCAECGWMGHRDKVGAINISRRAGLSDERRGAVGAS